MVMQSKRIVGIGWGCMEPVVKTTHLQKMSSLVGNPLIYVIPHGSAGWYKNSLLEVCCKWTVHQSKVLYPSQFFLRSSCIRVDLLSHESKTIEI